MNLSREVVIALELAETTIPYARSRQGEAERWLRILRRLERTGDALAALERRRGEAIPDRQRGPVVLA